MVELVAEGLVAVCGVCVQAMPAINKTRLEPSRKDFIKQISKDVAGGMLQHAEGWEPDAHHMADGIVAEFHRVQGLGAFPAKKSGYPVFLMLTSLADGQPRPRLNT
jgi:hypothetical protein